MERSVESDLPPRRFYHLGVCVCDFITISFSSLCHLGGLELEAQMIKQDLLTASPRCWSKCTKMQTKCQSLHSRESPQLVKSDLIDRQFSVNIPERIIRRKRVGEQCVDAWSYEAI